MRIRRTRNNTIPSQNLDSFLDILTNTVGVLMFIGLFVSLLAVEVGTVIRTPLRTETNKIGKFFELRNNQIFYINDPQIEQEIEKLISGLPQCYEPDIPNDVSPYTYDFFVEEIKEYQQCLVSRNRQLDQFYVNNNNYIVSFLENGSLKYEPVLGSQGDDEEELEKENSEFKTVLKSLDPNLNFIAFIVRPDSFSLFRTARAEAISEGFDVGWEPFKQDRVLIFGSGGRSIGVQ
jgi:hypothetical protein